MAGKHFEAESAAAEAHGKVSGSHAFAAADFGGDLNGAKSKKYLKKKDQMIKKSLEKNSKYQKRKMDKLYREEEREYEEGLQEALEQDRLEWEPKDKGDIKFHQKLAQKTSEQEKNYKYETQKLLEEEEKLLEEQINKPKKNGWGRVN